MNGAALISYEYRLRLTSLSQPEQLMTTTGHYCRGKESLVDCSELAVTVRMDKRVCVRREHQLHKMYTYNSTNSCRLMLWSLLAPYIHVHLSACVCFRGRREPQGDSLCVYKCWLALAAVRVLRKLIR